MKSILWLSILVLLIMSIPAFAQTPVTATNYHFGAIGLGYFAPSTPQFQGWGALGIPITQDGKAFSYTDFDLGIVKQGGQILVAGIQLQYSMRTGVAYRVYTNGTWSLFGLAAPGFVATGTTFASAFEYGGFIHKTVHKNLGVLFGLTDEHYGGQSNLAPRLGVTLKF